MSQTHLKVWIPPQASTNNQSLVWFDGPIPGGLPFDQAVVQFGHHSYNPEKTDGCGVGSTPCEAGTWHWNNISLSPSVPFSMIKAQQRFANAASPAVTFSSPAPANAYLRFSGHESTVEASSTEARTRRSPRWRSPSRTPTLGSSSRRSPRALRR